MCVCVLCLVHVSFADADKVLLAAETTMGPKKKFDIHLITFYKHRVTPVGCSRGNSGNGNSATTATDRTMNVTHSQANIVINMCVCVCLCNWSWRSSSWIMTTSRAHTNYLTHTHRRTLTRTTYAAVTLPNESGPQWAIDLKQRPPHGQLVHSLALSLSCFSSCLFSN